MMMSTFLRKMNCRSLSKTTSVSKSHHIRWASSSPLKVGILKETYDMWERRAPLAPQQVQEFLQTHSCQFLVQPCARRIFSSESYERAGATITDDLNECDIVLGVKRPLSMHGLPSHTTYGFFSHVQKGQPENMGLLQELLDQHDSLLDYECLVDQNGRRLVAFGKYAGMAGMVDTFSVLGQRLLQQYGEASPFLQCPPSRYHASLQDSQDSIRRISEQISTEGLSRPILVCMTGGPRGNVYSGVQEIFQMLPHEMVSVADLPEVAAQSGGNYYQVYGVAPTMADLYQRISGGSTMFDKTHFGEFPDQYLCSFANDIAPHCHVLMNGVYWNPEMPRLLTKQDMLELYESGKNRLMVISDISCDVHGSIELLTRSTTIDKPSFVFDPITSKEVTDCKNTHGVTIQGVDILPAELPLESSIHFGKAVLQVLDEIAKTKANQGSLDVSKLSPYLKNAMITSSNGTLTPKFQYLESILRHHRSQVAATNEGNNMVLLLQGHLFDSGLINQVLDVLEQNDYRFEFQECHVRHDQLTETRKSTAVLKISGDDLDKVEMKIAALVHAIEKADAIVRRMDIDHGYSYGSSNRAYVDSSKDHTNTVLVLGSSYGSSNRAYVDSSKDHTNTVLVLGSGHVSKSVVDMLGRNPNNNIIVVGEKEDQARDVASFAKCGSHVVMDVKKEDGRLVELIDQSNVVISLFPVPMHTRIAELCVDRQTDMVTASYESTDMRKLQKRVKEAGICILNEVGLDPGLDHMSAMKLIDDIKDRGGTITRFSSVCGGLPAPEVAVGNPLKYKFSWSPSGVIAASQSPARYRWEDHFVQIHGDELLQSASPFMDAWPDLHLECLPNRDSLQYEETYGIDGIKTMFRGTLRYRGFSSLLHAFKMLGMFENLAPPLDGLEDTWDDLLENLRMSRGGFESMDDFLLVCAEDDPDEAIRFRKCLEWLGMSGNSPVYRKSQQHHSSLKDLFCHVLQEKLQYKKHDNERDMVLMHHTIRAKFEDGTTEEHHSSLQAFGDRTMSAMCKTVGYTAAASTELILNGSFKGKHGLLLPTKREIYQPVLERVRKEGIVFEETVKFEQPDLENARLRAH